MRHFKERGEEGLGNKSSVPKNSPKRVAKEIEEEVVAIFHKTSYGFRRIARALKRTKGISPKPISPQAPQGKAPLKPLQ